MPQGPTRDQLIQAEYQKLAGVREARRSILAAMSGSNWLYHFALGVWLLAASPFLYAAESLSQEQLGDNPAAQESVEQTKNRPALKKEVPIEAVLASGSVSIGNADSNNTQNTAQDTEAEEQRAQANLEAQQKMARWAFWMIIVSAASAVIAGIAVFLVYLTLREAKNTTKVVEATLGETRKNSERQLRAYVMVEDIQLERPPAAQTGEQQFIIVINIKNSGQTPAKNHRVRCTHFFAEEYENSQFGDVSGLPATGATPISPQGTIAATMVPNQTGEDWRNFTNGATKLFVYGLITYEDAFENEWETTFRMDKEYNIIKTFSTLPEGNRCT